MRNILRASGLALISVALSCSLVAGAQDADARLLEVIGAAPRLSLQRSELVLEPSLAATSELSARTSCPFRASSRHRGDHLTSTTARISSGVERCERTAG
jgi:hypothetical protein